MGFYLSLGFVLVAGGSQTPFSSFAIGDGFLNLMARPNGPSGWEWGRLIFHVSDVDGLYRQALQLDSRGYEVSRDVYAKTPRAEVAD